ncbi:MAG: hypothetical protein L0Z53_01720 [Acidobacteriales bacterium]|nr:hypothetical protein [Terriglobales bacterium]
MAKDLAVVVIHGMGSQESNFADAMIDELKRRITRVRAYCVGTIFWADILRKRQDDYLKEARKKHSLDFVTLRRFVVSALGDATAYLRIDNDP